MTIEIIATWTRLVTAPRDATAFDEVIVPVDPDAEHHRAFHTAVSLAHQWGAGIVLVSVLEPDTRVPDEWRDRLRGLLATVTSVPARAVIVVDDHVAHGITRAAEDLGRAVVCMETDAPGRLRDAFQLTTTSSIVREAGCPVVLVGPRAADRDAGSPFVEVHAFVDGSETSERAAAAAAAWAAAAELPVWLVEVADRSSASDADVLESNHVARLAHRVGGPAQRVDYEVLHDRHAARAIVSWLEVEHPEALAVVGSHGRSGVAELRLGSVSMSVVHDSPVPVVVVPAPSP